MSRLLPFVLAAVLAAPGWAREKEAPVRPEVKVAPQAPKKGEPFDDLELDAYLEAASRQFLSQGKLPTLVFDKARCDLSLAAPGEGTPGWATVASHAEEATLVLGEMYREGKSKKDEFSVAAGAFLISESGAIVTCLHVAREKGTRGLTALLRDGRVLPVKETLAVDPLNDLVILQLDVPAGVKLPALALAKSAPPTATTIGVMSHPEEHFWMWTTGTVARHTVVRSPAGDEQYTTITADFAKGSSGCPVLDDHGNVIGVVNNTESIYYEDDGHKKQVDLQMVVRNVTPSWVLLKMINIPDAVTSSAEVH